MYLEFCAVGAVDGIMQELEKPLTEPQIQCVSQQMCKGIEFLHNNNIIHRDIKAGNVLLTVDGTVKLGELSWSNQTIILDEYIWCCVISCMFGI